MNIPYAVRRERREDALQRAEAAESALAAMRQRMEAAEQRNAELEATLDAVGEYAAYYNSQWWLAFDNPALRPMPFDEWLAQQGASQP